MGIWLTLNAYWNEKPKTQNLALNGWFRRKIRRFHRFFRTMISDIPSEISKFVPTFFLRCHVELLIADSANGDIRTGKALRTNIIGNRKVGSAYLITSRDAISQPTSRKRTILLIVREISFFAMNNENNKITKWIRHLAIWQFPLLASHQHLVENIPLYLTEWKSELLYKNG